MLSRWVSNGQRQTLQGPWQWFGDCNGRKTASLLAKDSLTKYNAEDCEALQHLTEFVSSLATSTAELTDSSRPAVVKVESLPRNASLQVSKGISFKFPNSRRLTKPLIGNINATEFL